MKKLTIIIFLLQISVLFGQNSQSHNCACSDKSKEIKREWGNYKTFDGFAGVRIRVKGPIDACYNAINNEPNVHTFRWNIEVSGSTNCVFRIDAKSNDGQLHPFGGQIEGECIIPGEIDNTYITRENESRMKSPTILTVNTFSNGETLNISLVKCISSNGNTTNTNQTTEITQQNDLTEYNRSKAEMEEKLGVENERIQRENQENSIKLNIWNNATKAGIEAHNSGNYAESKNQFTIAINNSTNEQNRQNAQNYYNKSVDAEKSQAKIKVVGDLVQGTLQILNDAHERKMQKLDAEIAELKSKNAIVDEDQKINTLNDPKIFETYCDYLANNLEKNGFNFEKLEYYNIIENNEKLAKLKFKGISVSVLNTWKFEGMRKQIEFVVENQNEYQKLVKSTFFNNLTKLDVFYDKNNNTFNGLIISPRGLERTEDFLKTYNQGYISKNYIGITILSKELDENDKIKFKNIENNISGILQKARLYYIGTGGVEKNYAKALELYQNAFKQNNDKEILRKISVLYWFGDQYLTKSDVKSEELLLDYLKENNKINPYVYVELAKIYNEKNSTLYDLKKGEIYLLKALAILEQNYNTEIDENKKKEINHNILSTYTTILLLYQIKLENPVMFVEYAEKEIQWCASNNSSTSRKTEYELAKLYADGKFALEIDKKYDNFKKDKKKAKYWASKVCEFANVLENKDKDSSKANNAKILCESLQKYNKELF